MGNSELVGGQVGGGEGKILRFLAGQLVADAGIGQPKVVAHHALQSHLLDGRHLGITRGRLKLQRRGGVLEHVENIQGRETVRALVGILKVQLVTKLAGLVEVTQELKLRTTIGQLLQRNVFALAVAGLEHRRRERLVELKIECQAGALDGGEAACVVDDLVVAASELRVVELGLRRLKLRELEHRQPVQLPLLSVVNHPVHGVRLHVRQAVAVSRVVEALHHRHPPRGLPRFLHSQLHLRPNIGELGRDDQARAALDLGVARHNLDADLDQARRCAAANSRQLKRRQRKHDQGDGVVKMRLSQAAVDLEFPALLVGRAECISQHPLLQVVEFVRIVFCNLLRSSLKQLVKTWMVLLDHPNDLSQRQPVYKQHFYENQSRHSSGTRPDDRPSKTYINASRLKRDGAETGHGAGGPANG